jgi:phenylpropionate dioxygenase-like ring-hydroxylating dioxygenase large terminal subunit
MNKPVQEKSVNGPDWARAIADPAAFAREQEQLGHVWTVIGLTTDIPNDNDWFRATLGGRSIFVQRFGGELRGFENKCAHRFYPLRTADRGNGVIRCGFHHWQYNKDGLAVGIPKCQELFGVTPRELDARLSPVEIETCGILIFGRFPRADVKQSLLAFLGPGYDIIKALCVAEKPPHYLERKVAANWKLCYQVTLDDYHIVAVHPDSFGKDGYMDVKRIRYFRFGAHSAFPEGVPIKRMAELCAKGEYRPKHYCIMQYFPNLIMVHSPVVAYNWYVIIEQYVPQAYDRTLLRAWFFPLPNPHQLTQWWPRLKQKLAAPWVPLAMRLFWPKILKEDHDVCELQQTIASQIDAAPILGLQEERIAWFEQSYQAAIGQAPAPKP